MHEQVTNHPVWQSPGEPPHPSRQGVTLQASSAWHLGCGAPVLVGAQGWMMLWQL